MTTDSTAIKIRPNLIQTLKNKNIAKICEGCNNLTDARYLHEYESGTVCISCKNELVQWACHRAWKSKSPSAEIIKILKTLRAVGVPYSNLPYIRYTYIPLFFYTLQIKKFFSLSRVGFVFLVTRIIADKFLNM